MKNTRERLSSVFYSCCHCGIGGKVVWTSKWLADSRHPCMFERETRVSKKKQLLEGSHTWKELWPTVSLGMGSTSWLRRKFILGHRTGDFWNIVQYLAGFSLQTVILWCLLVIMSYMRLIFSIYLYFSKLFLLCKYHLYITRKIQNCREVKRRKLQQAIPSGCVCTLLEINGAKHGLCRLTFWVHILALWYLLAHKF